MWCDKSSKDRRCHWSYVSPALYGPLPACSTLPTPPPLAPRPPCWLQKPLLQEIIPLPAYLLPTPLWLPIVLLCFPLGLSNMGILGRFVCVLAVPFPRGWGVCSLHGMLSPCEGAWHLVSAQKTLNEKQMNE